MYNLTLLKETMTVMDLFEAANQYSDNILISILTMSIFLILVMVQKKGHISLRFTIASYIAMVLTTFLAATKMLSLIYPLAFLILSAILTAYMVTARPNS